MGVTTTQPHRLFLSLTGAPAHSDSLPEEEPSALCLNSLSASSIFLPRTHTYSKGECTKYITHDLTLHSEVPCLKPTWGCLQLMGNTPHGGESTSPKSTKTISANGINIHIAEKGQGPLVLFLHGFPELWYSWRHQILYMAAHGYRAVAPDLRGYGDTTGAPLHDSTKFTTLHLVGDIVALLDAIAPDEKQVFVVGHDWGAIIAWLLCLYRPDRVKAHVSLSVHFVPRNPMMSTITALRKYFPDDHYICRFQEPGDIEAEFAQIGVREVVRKFLTYRDPRAWSLPKGKGFANFPDTPLLPSWLSEEDVDYYTSKFQMTGFTGGINYYRALDLNWELTAPWTGAQVKVPTKFIVGDFDLAYNFRGTKEYIHGGRFKKDVPLLDEVIVMEGVAHFINQEKPDEINQHILEYIKNF